MIHQARLLIAKRLATVRLHRWIESPDGVRFKYRKWGSEALVAAGNRYLQVQGALSECLQCREWIEWEVAVSRALKRQVQEQTKPRGIKYDSVHGLSLASLLQSNAPWEQKQQGLTHAGEALNRLHQQTITARKVIHWPLSHGDATCGNVIVDESFGCAHWIDFDMRHRIELTALTRQADDLRALIWSSAALVDRSLYHETCVTICDAYGEAGVIREMQNLTRRSRQPTMFQLAQAPLMTADFEQLHKIVGTGHEA